MRSRIKEYIGTKSFYRSLIFLALPVMLQSGLTNLVSLLDNLMVGAVGTDQMNGVSIVNQCLFVFNLCIFGGLGGVGIFTAQFYGNGDHKGVRDTFRFKILLALGIFAAGLIVLTVWGRDLIGLFLHEGGSTGDMAATLDHAQGYLNVMLLGLAPFALQQAYASTLRECGETALPMKAGVAAILLNLVLNWFLIGGHWGAPALGAVGAAVATVIARVLECAIIVIWCHRHHEKAVFVPGAYRSLRIPGALAGRIVSKGMPLLINELLWSLGMAALTQSYSTRGLAVVAGMNIASTVSNVFSIMWMSMGTAVSIMVGQQLGAGDFERVRSTRKQIASFAVVSAAAAGLLLFLSAPLFPRLYNTTDEVRALAVGFLRVSACAAPLYAYGHTTYFTLRAGGKTWITLLFDSAYVWLVRVVIVRLLVGLTALPEVTIFALCEGSDLLKCVFGAVLIAKGIWINNIVEDVQRL